MEQHERLKIFFERLLLAPPCASAEEAIRLVCHLIEEVENEFCPIPRTATPPKIPTGRMYPPQADSMRHMNSGHIRARTAGHVILCAPDGSIRIENSRKRLVEIVKPGAQS